MAAPSGSINVPEPVEDSDVDMDEVFAVRLSQQEAQINGLTHAIQSLHQLVQGLANNVGSQSNTQLPQNPPVDTSSNALNDGIIKELSKRVNSLPETSKLTRPENFDQ